MSFNKRFINREKILRVIKDGRCIKDLLNTDTLIIEDNWSIEFTDNYDLTGKFIRLRSELNDDTKFSSNLNDTINHKNFSKLIKINSLSNMLEILFKEPNWIDTLLVMNILNIKISYDVDDYIGAFNFDSIKNICIKSIIDHYTIESRDNIINDVLDGYK